MCTDNHIILLFIIIHNNINNNVQQWALWLHWQKREDVWKWCWASFQSWPYEIGTFYFLALKTLAFGILDCHVRSLTPLMVDHVERPWEYVEDKRSPVEPRFPGCEWNHLVSFRPAQLLAEYHWIILFDARGQNSKDACCSGPHNFRVGIYAVIDN